MGTGNAGVGVVGLRVCLCLLLLIAGKNMVRPLFLLKRSVFKKRFRGLIFWYLWIGRAKNPGFGPPHHLAVEVDFLAVTEHRLIPARVRSEWARLRDKGVASIWAPASQESSHVGNADVGVVSLRGAPLPLPTSATVQFKRFFDCGRAVRCLLPLGAGRVHAFGCSAWLSRCLC